MSVSYPALARQRQRQEAREYFARQRGVIRCICGWRYQGSFGVGRDLFKAHRRECEGRIAA